MAKRLSIPSKELSLGIVGPRDLFIASRVQRVNMNTDVPSTDVYELGNPQLTGVTKDTPNITLTFSAMDVGIKVFAALTGQDPNAYSGSGVDIQDLGEIDAILFVKSNTASDYIKSAHAKRLQIRDFTFTYSVDGESTEDYTAIGSEKRWFKNDVVVDKFTSGTTSFSLSETPIQLANGDYLLSVVLDGEYLTEVTGVPATGEYSVSGTTVTTGDTRTAQVLAVYHANPAGTNWSDVSDATMPAAIRGRDVKVVIGVEDILRVQSVTINGTLNSEAVREMGNRSIVGYQAQVPTVEGSITVLDTDTELIDLLINGSTDSGETEFEIGTTCSAGTLALEIKLYDPCDVTVSGTVLKTVYVPSFEVVGDSYTANVNNNVVQVFNFKSTDAQCLIYSGSR